MGASSNFGNMFSVLGASAFFPFLPMAPLQMLIEQSALRLFAGSDPDRQRRPEETSPTPPLADRRYCEIYPLYWPDQFHFRLYDFLRDAVRVSLLGYISRPALPDWLVRRIVDDADPDHSRDTHQKNPVY